MQEVSQPAAVKDDSGNLLAGANYLAHQTAANQRALKEVTAYIEHGMLAPIIAPQSENTNVNEVLDFCNKLTETLNILRICANTNLADPNCQKVDKAINKLGKKLIKILKASNKENLTATESKELRIKARKEVDRFINTAYKFTPLHQELSATDISPSPYIKLLFDLCVVAGRVQVTKDDYGTLYGKAPEIRVTEFASTAIEHALECRKRTLHKPDFAAILSNAYILSFCVGDGVVVSIRDTYHKKLPDFGTEVFALLELDTPEALATAKSLINDGFMTDAHKNAAIGKFIASELFGDYLRCRVRDCKHGALYEVAEVMKVSRAYRTDEQNRNLFLEILNNPVVIENLINYHMMHNFEKLFDTDITGFATTDEPKISYGEHMLRNMNSDLFAKLILEIGSYKPEKETSLLIDTFKLILQERRSEISKSHQDRLTAAPKTGRLMR